MYDHDYYAKMDKAMVLVQSGRLLLQIVIQPCKAVSH